MRVLTGPEIEQLASRGILFRSGFNKYHCETMFYSLTLGRKVQSVTKNELEFRELKEPLVIGPREVVNVEILEKFNFLDEENRPRYGGLIVSTARILAGGIEHPATVVDPGFCRAAYLTLINLRSYPGPRMFPGKDKIAKIVIFEYELNEQIPPPWEITPAYGLVSPDELPVFWPSPPEPWQPAQHVTQEDLEQLIDFGTPYDQIAVTLLNHAKAMGYFHRRIDSLSTTYSELKESVDEQKKELAIALPQLNKVSEEVKQSHNEIATWYQQRLGEKDRLSDRKLEQRRLSVSLWVSSIIALVAAILGGLITLYWNDILRFFQNLIH